MVIRSIVIGSWFPRTKLHLKEYFTFLKTGRSHLPIDADSLKKSREALEPSDVAYHGGRFDRVSARLGARNSVYHEDGLLLISASGSNDFLADVTALRNFYDNAISPALAQLYSVGTPTISPSVQHESKRPVIVIVNQATDQDISDLAAKTGDAVHFIARSVERTVYFTDDIIFVAGVQNDDDFDQKLAGEYVFFREYEHKLRHFLDLHRSVWESIEEMRLKKSLTLKDLPAIRDRLLDFHRDLSVLRARLGQMDAFLDERQAQIDDLGLTPIMRKLEAYRFGKMRIATKYMDRLWTMLDDYISSTVEITGLMYQENLQREINFQQFIFLLGSVAALIALGALLGSSIVMYGPDGTLLTRGVIKAFQIKDLAILGGGAFVTTLIIYLGIRPLVSSLKRIQVTSLLGSKTEQSKLPIEDDERPSAL